MRKAFAFITLGFIASILVAQTLSITPYLIRNTATTTPLVIEGSTQALIQFKYGGATKAYMGACAAGPCYLNDAGNITMYTPLGTQDVNMGSGKVTYGTVASTANCSSSASPAVCAAAPNGSVVIAAAATTVQVNTTAVTANSQIMLTPDSSLGTKLSVTCNTTYQTLMVTGRTAGSNFTITAGAAPTTNPLCLSYQIIN